MSYGFEFRKAEQVIATGNVVAVCCRVKAGEPLQSEAIPAELALRMTAFLQPAE